MPVLMRFNRSAPETTVDNPRHRLLSIILFLGLPGLAHADAPGTFPPTGWACHCPVPPYVVCEQRPSSPQPLLDDRHGVEFRMEGRPWGEVLEWLGDQSGLPCVYSSLPILGTFTFIGPKGAKYTLPEIMGILNRALLRQGYLLIKRKQSFTLVPDRAILSREIGGQRTFWLAFDDNSCGPFLRSEMVDPGDARHGYRATSISRTSAPSGGSPSASR
jgi:hypothetical protein